MRVRSSASWGGISATVVSGDDYNKRWAAAAAPATAGAWSRRRRQQQAAVHLCIILDGSRGRVVDGVLDTGSS